MDDKYNLCKDSEGSINHILVRWDKTRALDVVVGYLQFCLVVRNLFLGWKLKGLWWKKRVIWRLVMKFKMLSYKRYKPRKEPTHETANIN